jgi:hypothetical protein
MVTTYKVKLKSVSEDQIEQVARYLYKEWLKFAIGKPSDASKVLIVPHTLRYYRGITLSRTGANSFRIQASSKTEDGEDLADIIEMGHPAFNLADRMLKGRESRVVPLPEYYSSARSRHTPQKYSYWENRQNMKSRVNISSIRTRPLHGKLTPVIAGMTPAQSKTGRLGSTFVTMTQKNKAELFGIPAQKGYHPAKNLADMARGLSTRSLVRILSKRISL